MEVIEIKEEDNRKIENSIKKELREEGQEEEKLEIVKNMLSKNMDIKLISEITGLTEDQIKVLNN